MVAFTKMHGLGNDFVVLDERAGSLGLTAAQTRHLADRHRGIGCDQLISLEPAEAGADVFMRIRNPDGSEAGACGNATRCVATMLAAETGRRDVIVRTIAGDLPCVVLAPDRAIADMGSPRLGWQDVPLAEAMDTLTLPIADAAACSMGNPHATVFVPELAMVNVAEIGLRLEHHPLFPDRANIGFAQILAPDRIGLAVWERGAGQTLACGSGACAAIVNAHRRGLTGRRATITMPGGDLVLEWRESDGHVLMEGPVATVFAGHIAL